MSGNSGHFEASFRKELAGKMPGIYESHLAEMAPPGSDGSYELPTSLAVSAAIAASVDASILMLRKYYEWTEEGPVR